MRGPTGLSSGTYSFGLVPKNYDWKITFIFNRTMVLNIPRILQESDCSTMHLEGFNSTLIDGLWHIIDKKNK